MISLISSINSLSIQTSQKFFHPGQCQNTTVCFGKYLGVTWKSLKPNLKKYAENKLGNSKKQCKVCEGGPTRVKVFKIIQRFCCIVEKVTISRGWLLSHCLIQTCRLKDLGR